MQAGKTKAERKASRAGRVADRPTKRGERRAANTLRRVEQKTTATLKEDRKRSYLATYTEGVRAARELKKTLRANATTPAEAATNETR
jgi:hypothetical protein